MAEKDRKAGYDADQQQQQSARRDVSPPAADLMAAFFQQMQRQMRFATLNNTTPIDETQLRNAAFAGAAFSMITNGLTNLGGSMGISALSELEGPVAGGQELTLTGINFLPDSTVLFHETKANEVAVISPTEITLKTPPGASGTVDVVIVSAFAGEARRTSAYTYLAQ